MSKHHGDLNKMKLVWLLHKEYDAPWFLDIHNKEKNQEESPQQNVSDDEECYDSEYVNFLGFHPYKEVIFLCRRGFVAIAYRFRLLAAKRCNI